MLTLSILNALNGKVTTTSRNEIIRFWSVDCSLLRLSFCPAICSFSKTRNKQEYRPCDKNLARNRAFSRNTRRLSRNAARFQHSATVETCWSLDFVYTIGRTTDGPTLATNTCLAVKRGGGQQICGTDDQNTINALRDAAIVITAYFSH